MTWHRAFTPHVPGQGSRQFWFKHAWCCGQSVLDTQLGRQVGGEPSYPSWHEHTACSFTTLQILYGPHCDGTHGLISAIGAKKFEFIRLVFVVYVITRKVVFDEGLLTFSLKVTRNYRVSFVTFNTQAYRCMV